MKAGSAWRGTVSAGSQARIAIKVERRPRAVRINGSVARADYDGSSRIIVISVSEGINKIEIE